MSKNHENKHRNQEEKQASVLVQGLCVVGLVAYVIVCSYNETEVSPFIIAILGGGILGVDNVMKFIRAIFRIGGDNGQS